jgi:hypothetical protein
MEYPEYSPEYFCTNIREPTEIQKLVDWCKYQGIPCHTVWIRREISEQKALDEHFLCNGDNQFMKYDYDYIIHNDETKEDFKQKIKLLIGFIKGVTA